MTAIGKEIVAALHAALRQRLGDERYELWFKRSARLICEDAQLRVVCTSCFVQEILKRQVHRELRECAQATLGHQVVQYEVGALECADEEECEGEEPERSAVPLAESAPAPVPAPQTTSPLTPAPQPVENGPRVSPKSSAPQTTHGPRRRQTLESFETFVVGDGNRLAFTASELVGQRPGHTSPLLLHGPTATGKTHLLEAIRSRIKQQEPRCVVLYLTAEQFTSAFVEALYRKELPVLRKKYRSADVLLLDDLHFFVGKAKTTGELLWVIDTLHREGRQLVFTANCSPAELSDLGPETASRLAGGMTAELEPPDYATRLSIAQALDKRMELQFPQSVLQLVATQVGLDARGIRGALHRLCAESMASGRPLSRASAEETLGQMAQETQRPVRLADVERAVCDVFGVESKSLKSARKAASVSGARMLAMFLARKYTRAALVEIGHHFGRRSHSTVIAASKRVQQWMNRGERLVLADRRCGVEEAIRRVEEELRRSG